MDFTPWVPALGICIVVFPNHHLDWKTWNASRHPDEPVG
jgi:hypothetical protein